MKTTSTIDPYELSHRYNDELDLLASISRLLGQQSGQKEMLADVVRILEQKAPLSNVTVMLLAPNGEELVVEATRLGNHDDRKDRSYLSGEGVTGRAFKSGQTQIVQCVGNEPSFCGRIHNRSGQDVYELSFICLPILLGSEVVGTLSADLPRQSESTLRDFARLLRIVAGLVAFDVKYRRLVHLERETLRVEKGQLLEQLRERFRPENIIGNSGAMRDVYRRIHQVAPSDTTVLIRGESGTGKELVASAIHFLGRRNEGPFIKVNCAALSESLLESELFGHEKGAFTGAERTRIGRIEEAHGGTLLLDEIGDFSPAVQVKLLRVLQQKEFQRVGGNQTIKADVRILAATNRDLESDVDTGVFRQDLYYRINVFPIHLPPLRHRKDDILLLVDHFVKQYAQEMGKTIHRISTPAINMMCAYHWPGNVRELENCIEHSVLLASDGVIHGHCLPPTLQMPEVDTKGEYTLTLQERVDILQRDMIVDALKQTGGNIAAAARILGITARMARYKVKNLGIDIRQFSTK